MSTLLYSHPACLYHDTGEYHPERADRLRAVLAALDAPAFAGLDRREAPRAAIEDLLRVHPRSHVEGVLAAIPASGHRGLDPDTIVSPGSGEAALRAAGAVAAAVDAVMAGEATNAFCAVRPPGHHAEPDRAMGFCLFNNIAIGALRAHQEHGCERVAVIDFDVHHGNGTQATFARDPRLFYASTHQWPLYPGTGARDERGIAGNIVNAPLQPNAGSADFRFAVAEFVLPALEDFRPDFLFISAGFDAHRRDPLAALNLSEEDYAWITGKLTELAGRHCAGRVVSALEGGYDLEALADSAAAHVAALMRA
ncbi:MAG: histone deacetylase family protein [Alphaproteobacteria bacterium]|nr:histone deacetylase family protein [Alphaproteobacteria bacterium]